jgi:two-component system phosphate regulon response regulator PhoB
VLDDHPGSRRMLAYVLAARGHRCVAVESAEEARSTLTEFAPDAVIYDWNLRAGKLRGFAQDVKARCSSVHGVVVTSSLDEPPEFQGAEGLDGYFTKPLAMGEVVVRVELIVRSRK